MMHFLPHSPTLDKTMRNGSSVIGNVHYKSKTLRHPLLLSFPAAGLIFSFFPCTPNPLHWGRKV